MLNDNWTFSFGDGSPEQELPNGPYVDPKYVPKLKYYTEEVRDNALPVIEEFFNRAQEVRCDLNRLTVTNVDKSRVFTIIEIMEPEIRQQIIQNLSQP